MATQSKRTNKDVKDVVVHAGGVSPGVSGSSSRAASRSPWFALLKKGASVAAGMVGLAAIGLVAGAPKSDRLELMSVAPGLGGDWLAGPAETASAAEPATKPEPEEDAQGKPNDVPSGSGSAGPDKKIPTADGAGGGSVAPKQSGVTADGKVILNVADASELERLPGVGNKRALKIIELREQLGRFKKPTQLLRIKGIGPKSLRKMLPHLVLDPPEPEPEPEPDGQGGSAP